MSSSPYEPPRAELESPGASKDGSVFKALLLGAAADVVTTFTVVPVLGVAMAVSTGVDFTSSDGLESVLNSSTAFLASSLALGIGCTALGGYVAARVRNREEIRIGIYYAILMTGFGALFASSMAGYPTWYIAASYLFIPPAAILGAHARKRTSRSRV